MNGPKSNFKKAMEKGYDKLTSWAYESVLAAVHRLKTNRQTNKTQADKHNLHLFPA